MLRGNHPLLQSRLAFRCMENQSRSVSLLQNDEEIETREQNLEKAKRKYQLEQKNIQINRGRKESSQFSRCSTVDTHTATGRNEINHISDKIFRDRCFLQNISMDLWKRNMENTGYDQPF